MTGPRSFWVRWRVAAAYPLALVGLWLARPTSKSFLIGGIVALIGLLIRCLAAGVVRKGEQLATSGPYAWTRNPLYFGSVILAAGFAVIADSWIVGALMAAYLLIFYPAVIKREEADLRGRFGARFDAYAARVPAFFPWPHAQPAGAPGFSWAQYVKNHEYRAVTGAVLALALLAARMWIRIRFNS
jgi:protein-S-isoprenylcysteine O-methyltransferase Ste14